MNGSWSGHYCRFIADNCPGHADPARGGCQFWWDSVEENLQTGEVRVNSNCGMVLQKRLLDEVAKASRSYAAATETSRDYVAGQIVGALEEIRERSLQQALLLQAPVPAQTNGEAEK